MKGDTSQGALIIFAKNPLKSAVKTRLAKTVGEDSAKKIYEHMLHKLVNNLSQSKQFEVSLHISGDETYFVENFPNVRIEQQAGESLGDKMSHALSHELKTYKKALIIGTDCPDITCDDISQALTTLDSNDVVLGPAEDGGYYLVGMSQVHDIFSGIVWSTDTVYEETTHKIDTQNLTLGALTCKRDVDYYEDYIYYKEQGIITEEV